MESAPRHKKKLGSYPYASVIFSITLALTVLGMFGWLLITTNSLTREIQENVEMQVFLQKYVQESERLRIQQTISSKPYILEKDGVPQVRFIDKEEAAETLTQDLGEDFTRLLGENPLRDALIIKLNPDYYQDDKITQVKNEIAAIEGVYEVSYVENLVQSIRKNVTAISLVLLGFATILIILISILINNTIKLALFSQRFLIRSMQLVGAKASFIQKPFLLRALGYGALAGLLSCAIIVALLQYGETYIPDLNAFLTLNNQIILFGSLILLGMFIAFISTFFSITKYLKLSLDELY